MNSPLAYQILSRFDGPDGVMTSYWFYEMAAIASQVCFRLLVWRRLTFKKAQSYWHTKFRPDFSIHGRDITTSVCENKRLPYWNSTSGFNFDLFTVISVWFCMCLPNFMQIGWSPTVMTSYRFSRWRPYCKYTSSFWFYHVSHLRRSEAVGIPNFDQLSQSTADILLLPVLQNKRAPYWNSISGFDFAPFHSHRHVVLHQHAKFHRNLIIRRSYGFIAIFKMAADSHVGFGLK